MKQHYQPKKLFIVNLENITDKDYPRAKKIWDVFEIKNLGEYHDLYLQIYLKILEICVLIYMNLILYILHLHLD